MRCWRQGGARRESRINKQAAVGKLQCKAYTVAAGDVRQCDNPEKVAIPSAAIGAMVTGQGVIDGIRRDGPLSDGEQARCCERREQRGLLEQGHSFFL